MAPRQRDGFRGHDQARAADRDRARQSMQQRGFETPAATNREAAARAGQASQQMGQQRNAEARQGARQQYSGSQQRNNAFAGASNPGQSRASSSRGRSSYSASQRSGSRGGGGRQMSRPRGAAAGRRRPAPLRGAGVRP